MTTHDVDGRVLTGRCPQCDRVIVVHNNGESWPLVACRCGWKGGTREVAGAVLTTPAEVIVL